MANFVWLAIAPYLDTNGAFSVFSGTSSISIRDEPQTKDACIVGSAHCALDALWRNEHPLWMPARENSERNRERPEPRPERTDDERNPGRTGREPERARREPSSTPVTIADGIKLALGVKKFAEWNKNFAKSRDKIAKALPAGSAQQYDVYYDPNDHRYVAIAEKGTPVLLQGGAQFSFSATIKSSQKDASTPQKTQEEGDSRPGGRSGGGGSSGSGSGSGSGSDGGGHGGRPARNYETTNR